MSFDTVDAADLGGQPLYLLDFYRQTKHWRYTTADRPMTNQSQVFNPAAITVPSFKQSQELKQQTLTITAPRDIDVVSQYRTTPPADAVNLTIWAMHYVDNEPVVVWLGRVVSPKWVNSTVQIACEPISTAMRSTGLRLRWCRNCPYALYGVGCNVDFNAHRVPAKLTAVNGFTLTADAFASLPNGRFAGGYVEWLDADGIVDRRSIDAHTGTSITVAFGSADLAPGLAVSAYPGCNHTMNDCDGYFHNGDNYGGSPNIPDVSAFNGNLVL